MSSEHLSEEQENINAEALVRVDSELHHADPLSHGIVLELGKCPQLLILRGLEKKHAGSTFVLGICAYA